MDITQIATPLVTHSIPMRNPRKSIGPFRTTPERREDIRYWSLIVVDGRSHRRRTSLGVSEHWSQEQPWTNLAVTLLIDQHRGSLTCFGKSVVIENRTTLIQEKRHPILIRKDQWTLRTSGTIDVLGHWWSDTTVQQRIVWCDDQNGFVGDPSNPLWETNWSHPKSVLYISRARTWDWSGGCANAGKESITLRKTEHMPTIRRIDWTSNSASVLYCRRRFSYFEWIL